MAAITLMITASDQTDPKVTVRLCIEVEVGEGVEVVGFGVAPVAVIGEVLNEP